jgi:hypothetical protein
MNLRKPLRGSSTEQRRRPRCQGPDGVPRRAGRRLPRELSAKRDRQARTGRRRPCSPALGSLVCGDLPACGLPCLRGALCAPPRAPRARAEECVRRLITLYHIPYLTPCAPRRGGTGT